MPKGVPNKKYIPEFKKLVVETIWEENLSYWETAARFGVLHKLVAEFNGMIEADCPNFCVNPESVYITPNRL